MKIVQSNSHHCFVCGVDNPAGLKVTFTGNGEGEVWTKTCFSGNHQGYPGIVHGGVIAAILDEAAGRATMKHKRPEVNLVTGKMTIRYLKPVRVNEEVLVEGKVITTKGRVYQCQSKIRSEKDGILAEAEVVLVEPGQELLSNLEIAGDQWIDQEDQEADNDH
jgi:uncharacterized protein (TIGR00369 family)